MVAARVLRELSVSLSSEGSLDERCFPFAGLVVRVDKGGLEVTVAHPFLERSERNAGRCHAGAEGVAQVVETHFSDPRARKIPLEAFENCPASQRLAAVRVAEHEVVVGLEGRALEPSFKFSCRAIGEGNRSA